MLVVHTAGQIAAVITGGIDMDISTLEAVKTAVDIGITPVLLIVLMYFFLGRSKKDAEQIAKMQDESQRTITDAYKEAQEKIEESARTNKDRIESILAENARREDLIREAAEAREELIRKDSEKRESILMTNMERMVDSMGEINKSMKSMESSFAIIERRLEKIEQRVG